MLFLPTALGYNVLIEYLGVHDRIRRSRHPGAKSLAPPCPQVH